MLDATKAFDRVEYCKLIRSLLTKRLPVIIVRFLLNIYLFQATRVAWNGCNSQCITVVNGVRQGAVLSPVLFCIYFDELINELQTAKYGCYIGFCFVGVLAYADDLVLLARTRQGRCLKYVTNLGNETLLFSMLPSQNVYFVFSKQASSFVLN